MARIVTYRCPDCGGSFDFMHHPSTEPPPSHCELCHAYMGDEPEKAPVLHINLGTKKNKVPDQVYRQMEAASEARQKEAADMVGCRPEELPSIKMTDMKDNQREGDVAAMTLPGADARIKKLAEEGRANLSHLGPAATGQMPQLQRPVVPLNQPNVISPQVAGWIDGTTSGNAALATRSMIDTMQTSGRFRDIEAATTRNGQQYKRVDG